MKKLFIVWLLLISVSLYSLELSKVNDYYLEKSGSPTNLAITDSGFLISTGNSITLFSNNEKNKDLSSFIPEEMVVLSSSYKKDKLLLVVGAPGWFSSVLLYDFMNHDIENMDLIIDSDAEDLFIRKIFWDSEDSFIVERSYPNEHKVEIQKYSIEDGYIETILSRQDLTILEYEEMSKGLIYSERIRYSDDNYYLKNGKEEYIIQDADSMSSATFISQDSFIALSVTGLIYYTKKGNYFISNVLQTEEARVFSIKYDIEKDWLYILGNKNGKFCLTIYNVINN